MKKRELIRVLTNLAVDKEVSFTLSRQGKHEIWQFGELRIAIPRHSEIAEGTARAIIRRAEQS